MIKLHLFILSITYSLSCASASANETLNLGSNENLVEQVIAGDVLTHIYELIGVKVKIQELPPKRANIENINLKTDGEVARIYTYGVNNPSLIRVEPPYYKLVSAVFALKSSSIKINSKADLEKYKIAVIAGVAHSKDATEGLANVTQARNAENMFEQLKRGRVQLAVDTEVNGKRFISGPEFSDIELVGVVAKLDLYHMLNERTKAYQKKISDKITSLKKSGELDKIIAAAEKKHIQNRPKSKTAK